MKQALFAIVLVLSLTAIADADSPPREFVDRGACPFECCVYREWKTKKDTAIYAQPDRNAKMIGLAKAGAAVEALTGEVHTMPGRFLVTSRHAEYKPGDVLWVYTYLGEGHFRVWWMGTMREVDLGFSPYGGSSGTRCEESQRCWGQLENPIVSRWWVKLRSEGVEGWSDQPEHFDDKDACG